MDPHLREGALPYFANKKQWNFGRFLHHLDTIPHFPKDKKSRHELGTEVWTALLWEFAGEDSHPEYKLKALQELAKLKKQTTTATNNTNTNCTVEKNKQIFLITPTPEAKEVEVVNIKQGGEPSLDDRVSAVPPPPYESCPWKKLPNSDLGNPDIVVAAVGTRFTPESVHHAECEVVNATAKYPLETATPGDEFAGLDFSELGCGDFSDILGEETADLLAAFDFGEAYLAPDVSVIGSPFSQHPTTEDTGEPGMAHNINLSVKAPSVRSNTTNDSLRELFSESPTPSTSSNRQRRDGIHHRSPTPTRRVPSFSEFDAIGSDCSGCCLHRYPPTQLLCSQSTHRNTPAPYASSTPHTQVPSPHTRSLGVPTPGAYASPAHVQSPSLRDHREQEQQEVYPTEVISTVVTATTKASQSLKRSLESSSCNFPSPQDHHHHHSSDPQDSDASKANRARRNFRKLLEMQKTVTELLLDVLDDWPALSEGPPGKRQRQE